MTAFCALGGKLFLLFTLFQTKKYRLSAVYTRNRYGYTVNFRRKKALFRGLPVAFLFVVFIQY
jgi:hypothetical protein